MRSVTWGGKGEVGEGEGEEINNGEGRGGSQGRATLCLPRWIKRDRVSEQRTSTY